MIQVIKAHVFEASIQTSVITTLGLIAAYHICRTLATIFFGPLRSIPGPWHARFTNLPLTYHTITGRRIYYVHDLHLRYGPVVRLGPKEVDISDVETFREIHRIGGSFVKTEWYAKFTPNLPENIFAYSDVQAHSAARRVMARPFSNSSLRENFEDVVASKTKSVVTSILKEAETGVCDVFKWWTLMTTDVIHEVAFGDDSGMLTTGHKTEYVNDLELQNQAAGLQADAPLLVNILKIVSPKTVAAGQEAMKRVQQYGLAAAEKGLAGKLSKSNIISGLFKDNESGTNNMSVSAIGDQASALIIAGSGTTAVSLTYAVWAIMSRPDVRQKLERELSTLPPSPTDRELESLPYLSALITETLRLYGAAPGGLPRYRVDKGTRVKEHFIPDHRGLIYSTQAYTLHRDPSIFPNPEEFDPERFIEGLNPAQKAAFCPFGAGSRICLGIHLAYMEMRHALSQFFRQGKDLVLAETTTSEVMEMENYFLVAPRGKRCDLRLSSSN